MEPATSIETAKHVLLSGGIILGIGTVTAFLAQKLKIPDVALFLVAGIAIGPEALGLIDVKADSALSQIILLFGASFILFDGGASMRFDILKRIWITIVIIATAGVLVTAAIVGVAAYYVLGVPIMVAFLLGATLAATDPATLIPVFRQLHIRERIAQMLISESAFNDATGAILTFTVLGQLMGTAEFSFTWVAFGILEQAVVGAAIGVGLGYLAALLIAHERWAFLAEYAPVVALVAVIGAYLAATGFQASGFAAVFVFGIMIGNKDALGFKMAREEAQKLDEFVLTTAFIMRLLVFVLLGAQVEFALIHQYLVQGIIMGMVLMVIARPATVFLCALPDRRARWQLNELLLMCWTRETGVIPAALAGLLLGMNAPGARPIAATTLIAILMTILIQATTTKALAARLGLLTGT